jgi:hypothetical protein
MNFIHTHHLGWLVVVLFLNSPLVPLYPGVPSCWALIFVVAFASALCPITTIPSALPLMEILLLQARPCNHGLLVEVVLPVLFVCLDMCDHDSPFVIPALTIARACCVTNFSLHRTCSWKRCDPISVW